MLIPSSESIFNCSKVLSRDRESTGMRCVSAITWITLASKSSISECSGI